MTIPTVTDYFLSAATLETGQRTMTHTTFVFRLSKGGVFIAF